VTLCELDSNQAKGDGGLFYLGGNDINTLTLDSTQLSNQMSIAGHGGISSMRGKEAKVVL
jgi:hypothetical protein